MKTLRRDEENGIVGGVCAGLGNYFSIDPSWIRLALVLFVIFSVGSPILIYVIMWIIIPE